MEKGIGPHWLPPKIVPPKSEKEKRRKRSFHLLNRKIKKRTM